MIQLKVRTEFSFGETFAPINRIIDRLKAIGCTAAGIVDPGTWGHVQWYDACNKAGIQPLFGFSCGVVPTLESDDNPSMWFLALNSEGLKELYRLSSRAQRQAVRGRARLSYADVLTISPDIAKFAGQILDRGLLASCSAIIDFDPSSPHLNRRKAVLARENGLSTVIVSDNAYASPEDRTTFEMIGTGSSKPTAQHLLRREECAAIFADQPLAACWPTMEKLAASAKGTKLPHAPLIKVDGNLEALCREGIKFRGMESSWTPEYEARLQRELGLIRDKDFESYFLVVADMVNYAKQHMLVGPSRGSAAGSLVCYLTRITEVDPIPSRLIFERFIDVTRKDLPDIDLDFTDTKRSMVIAYLRDKYGAANVAHIGTVSTYQPKSALVAVAKKLGVPPWETAAVKDSIFARSSGDSRANFALLDTLEQTEPGRKLLEKHPAMRLAANLEAHASHSGVHAAGILVCNEAIENFCTVTADGVAQLDKKDAEKVNLLKIDVLGLRTLGVLEDSGVPVDWYAMKFDDPAVWKVLNDKRFAGVFQFEGEALQLVCTGMTVKNLDDIGHITALARPGPMASGGTKDYLLRRAGMQAYNLPHAALEPYVKDTFGVVVYQEQVLQICRELGRMSWEDVTLLRKAMSKSLGKEYFDQFRDKFIAGAAESGIDREPAIGIWEMVNTMGSWAFNLAHSYSYAVVSYWTAWLKANHLLEFAAATLRNAKDDESVIKLLRELTKEGVSYVPFDANMSEANWCVKSKTLYGGFMGLKGIGLSKAAKMLEERAKNGGKMPEGTVAVLDKLERTYADIFPTERRFGDMYANPQKYGIREGSKITKIADITGEAEFVIIGRLTGKDLRDQNEAIRVARRNGKRYSGPTLFLDLDITDDTARILCRVDRYDFEELGRSIWDGSPVGTWWMIRGERKLFGKPDAGFKMIWVKKIKQLDDPFRKEDKK